MVGSRMVRSVPGVVHVKSLWRKAIAPRWVGGSCSMVGRAVRNRTAESYDICRTEGDPSQGESDMANPAKNTICLWYNDDAEGAARFYAKTFPDSSVGAVHRAPGDYPSRKKGDVLTVEFTVIGIPCLGLNGGPQFKHTEAFS